MHSKIDIKSYMEEMQKRLLENFEDTEIHCEKHGSQIVSKHKDREELPRCPHCVSDEEEEERRRKEFLDFVRITQIPRRYQDKKLSNYHVENDSQKRALAVVNDYINEFASNRSRSLIITGGVGTGKTHLAAAIIRKLYANGYRSRYTTIGNMFAEVRATFNNGNSWENEDTVLEKYLHVSLLVIDEAGMSDLSKFEDGFLYRVINGRYENERATVVISNQHINDLAKSLGDRVVDRLREDGGKLINMQHQSYRR